MQFIYSYVSFYALKLLSEDKLAWILLWNSRYSLVSYSHVHSYVPAELATCTLELKSILMDAITHLHTNNHVHLLHTTYVAS